MRPQKIGYESLVIILKELREAGSSYKAIGKGLGYHYDHVAKLCKRFGISKQLKPVIDERQRDSSGTTEGEKLRPEEA